MGCLAPYTDKQRVDVRDTSGVGGVVCGYMLESLELRAGHALWNFNWAFWAKDSSCCAGEVFEAEALTSGLHGHWVLGLSSHMSCGISSDCY